MKTCPLLAWPRFSTLELALLPSVPADWSIERRLPSRNAAAGKTSHKAVAAATRNRSVPTRHWRSTHGPASALITMNGVSWWLDTIVTISTTATAAIAPWATPERAGWSSTCASTGASAGAIVARRRKHPTQTPISTR